MIIQEALTFDDVLLVPKRSPVSSRKDIDLTTDLTRNLKLKIPLVSANMDTVTEKNMAIIIAREGGIGIIHRFMSMEDQLKEVQFVKRADNLIIENPYIIEQNKTLAEAKESMKQHNVTGILVADKYGILQGILTRRDLMFVEDDSTQVKDLMTPKPRLIMGKPNISLEDAKKMLAKHRLEKLPLVDDSGKLCGLITTVDVIKRLNHPYSTRDGRGRLKVGAAIGVKDGYIERAQALVEAGCDVLVVDIAHGHSDLAIDTIKELKRRIPNVDVIAGNVATAEGTKDLIDAGADAIKVGVGGGSICITRIVTGAGVPQLHAILECAKIAQKAGVPIIADGGIKTSGDLTKAIAAGASTGMLGNLLAGTDESPGIMILRNGAKHKICRGMASFGANLGRKERTGEKENNPNDFVAEGVEATVPYRGKAAEVIQQLIGGLRSGVSYCGARTIKEMQKNAEFIKISSAGLRESHPHDVNLVK